MIVIWSPALLGILFKLTIAHRFKILSLVTYLTMGWLSLIVVYQLAVKLAVGGVTLLAVGGVVYSLGSSSTSANVFLITTLSGTASCSAAACVTSRRFIFTSASPDKHPRWRCAYRGYNTLRLGNSTVALRLPWLRYSAAG